ncbi:MAG: glycoside hydrolase family 140 protein [Prolixibacteraceae bacterium]|nr:glycoside hydrolase family 140 protein [Prolixibacteraceae bacterium]
MKTIYLLFFLPLMIQCTDKEVSLPHLKISENKRFLMTDDATPFFWLGDTGWLLFKKLNREETEKYLEDRKQKGFNVVQVMLIHDIGNSANAYGDSAIFNKNIANINTTQGSDPTDENQYDYWDHVDYVVKLAEKKGIYMAFVPIWGSNVRAGYVSPDEAGVYASFLANRYKNQSNIIWLNGGDVRGTDSLAVWQTIGNTIHEFTSNQLITFHPFGRTLSSDWFHHEKWLDFNMFQSGHRRYDQDNTERCFGEDSWRYVTLDYHQFPTKPTIDGEPSYEHIPQGLHDSLQPKWTGDDVRRYAYWSVFAGAFGHTYGHSSIMQFYGPDDTLKSYYPTIFWEVALDEPGGCAMKYLKDLVLSKPYFDRIPDQSMIVEGQGEKYDYLIACRGERYALVYTYSGRQFSVDGTKLKSSQLLASWFNPRNGETTFIDTIQNGTNIAFDPPGDVQHGKDWVLVLEASK